MKALLSASILFATAIAARPRWHQLDGYTFDAYARDFGKVYDASESVARKGIFEANLAKIRAHNADLSSSWRAGVNHLSDRTPSERRALLGYTKGVAAARRASDLAAGRNEYVEAAKLGLSIRAGPREFNWLDKGVISAIKDQGPCGSCWAFASTETLESHIAISTGGLPDLAVQQIVSCTPNPDGCGGTGGCYGGTPELAYEYLATSGMASAYTYGYESYWNTFNATCHYNPRVGGTPKVATVGGHVRVPSNDADALYSAVLIGPVVVALDASAWSDYESGIFTGCSTTDSDLNHAVVVVGWGVDREHGGYWLIRNSWAPTWGEDGFIRIPRVIQGQGQEHCMIDTHPLDGTACRNPPPPPNVTVCGACGLLYDPVYPTNVGVV